MKEKLEDLIKQIESYIDYDFDFDIEHWDNGNFDDRPSSFFYDYGVKVGEQYAYRELLVKLRKLYKS